MPKGVYARKSAPQKAAAKGKAKKAAPKRARAAAARPPRVVPVTAPAQLASVVTTPAADLADREPQYSAADFRRPIDAMDEPMLKAYARSIGILQRDVESLSEDRLRQNCKARVFEALED